MYVRKPVSKQHGFQKPLVTGKIFKAGGKVINKMLKALAHVELVVTELWLAL